MANDASENQAVLDFVDLDQVDIDEIVKILSGSLSTSGATAKNIAFWSWKHVHNPAGRSLGLAAKSLSDGSLIAVRPMMHWRFKTPCFSELCQVVRPVDTVTHPDWRGKGIFRSLTLRAISKLGNTTINLAFNTPNKNSLPGYLKLGWQKACELQVYLALGRSSAIFNRVIGKRVFSLVESPWEKISHGATYGASKLSEEQVDEILGHCSEFEGRRMCSGFRTFRDVKFLRWRFIEQPNVDYGFTIVRDSQDKIQSVVVARLEIRAGLLVALIQDVFVADSKLSTVRRAIKGVRKDLNVAFLAAHFIKGSIEYKAMMTSGFLPVKKVTLAVREIGKPTESLINFKAENRWDLTLSDIEVF